MKENAAFTCSKASTDESARAVTFSALWRCARLLMARWPPMSALAVTLVPRPHRSELCSLYTRLSPIAIAFFSYVEPLCRLLAAPSRLYTRCPVLRSMRAASPILILLRCYVRRRATEPPTRCHDDSREQTHARTRPRPRPRARICCCPLAWPLAGTTCSLRSAVVSRLQRRCCPRVERRPSHDARVRRRAAFGGFAEIGRIWRMNQARPTFFFYSTSLPPSRRCLFADVD